MTKNIEKGLMARVEELALFFGIDWEEPQHAQMDRVYRYKKPHLRLKKSYNKYSLELYDRNGAQIWGTHLMTLRDLDGFVDGMVQTTVLQGLKKKW